MSTCLRVYDGSAYVLGALSPDERLSFEAHLEGCAECRLSVREVAGLPGLLGRVSPAEAVDVSPTDPAPATLLPRLLAAARARRRRRTRQLAFLVAACLVLVAAASVPLALRLGAGGGPAPSVAVASPSTARHALAPVGAALPVTASVEVTPTAWGTRILLRCAYARASYSARHSYLLVAVSDAGLVDPLGSWSVAPGESLELGAATRFALTDLAAIEMRTPEGRTLLRTAV